MAQFTDDELVDACAVSVLSEILSHDFDDSHKNVAERAFRVGDAMLAERKKRQAAAAEAAATAKKSKDKE